jgi:serine/threonine protein phosphatase PrpC
MEDDSTIIGDYKGTGFSFFSVFDGHGGSNVAHYASKNLYQLVFESEAFKNGAYEESLKQSFLKIDRNLLAGL